ncbi:unnamed protein product [Linum trigynum]|uniref:Uncharacterized protein n=1 Tax=Linum trigynum TaxID=586398 RepID=A0AAV2DK68_9ROSI
MFEKFYADNVAAPSEDEIEISKKCCLAVMVKLMESRHDRVREHPYEVLYSNDSIRKEVSRINDTEMQLMARMGYQAKPPTPFDYLPRLVVEYFPDASEYETSHGWLWSTFRMLQSTR